MEKIALSKKVDILAWSLFCWFFHMFEPHSSKSSWFKSSKICLHSIPKDNDVIGKQLKACSIWIAGGRFYAMDDFRGHDYINPNWSPKIYKEQYHKHTNPLLLHESDHSKFSWIHQMSHLTQKGPLAYFLSKC